LHPRSASASSAITPSRLSARNPGAAGKVLVQSILALALAEGLGVLSLVLLH